MKRVAELDSLRGLAAIVVLLFHLDPLRFFPGWTGVDLFFVLSGFLITSIILRDANSPGFYRAFYARRTLRIWPIYYLTLLTLVAINSFLAEPDKLADLPYALTYTQNLPLYFGHKAPPAHPGFNHAWTLALEEQFYLFWPALVIWAGRSRLAPLCLLAVSISLACRSGEGFVIPRFHDRLLLARSDGFALGGLLAWAFAEGGTAGRRRLALSTTLLVGLGGSVAYLTWGCQTFGALQFIGLPTPLDPVLTIFGFAVAFASVVGLVALHAGSPWLAPLRFRPLAYLGQISYGLYLYHYVVYWVFDGCHQGLKSLSVAQPWPTMAAKLLTSLALAVASWHLIERPILRWKERFPYQSPPTASSNAGARP